MPTDQPILDPDKTACPEPHKSEEFLALLEEAIKLEMSVATVYLRFSEYFPEDKALWWTLSMEEGNHAALLKSGRDFLDAGMFPAQLLGARLEELKRINAELTHLIVGLNRQPPSRAESLRIAYNLECSAGEAHFQLVMKDNADSEAVKLFQRLNGDDRDHCERIRCYAECELSLKMLDLTSLPPFSAER